MRHADAGYEKAIENAKKLGVKIPKRQWILRISYFIGKLPKSRIVERFYTKKIYYDGNETHPDTRNFYPGRNGICSDGNEIFPGINEILY